MLLLTGSGRIAVDDLAVEAAEWAASHGLVVGAPSAEGERLVAHAPLSLLPTPFPRSAFERARNVQTLFNILMHRASRDNAFLQPIVDEVSEVDPFTASLNTIYQHVLREGDASPVTLGLHRSDYLLHAHGGDAPIPQQVELNTIAASFSSLSSITARLHRFLSTRYGLVDRDRIDELLPKNDAIEFVPRGLAAAHAAVNLPGAIVVMVVQPGERNAFDQRHIEYILAEKYGITLRRYSLAQIDEYGVVDPETRRLTIRGEPVSVVYYRAGYTPTDYPTDREWAARLLVERSAAVKCPSIAYHLVGMKKVQQVFAQPGVVERFMGDVDSAALRACFTGLYSMSGEEGERAVQLARERPDAFVLKPQREGGGNNFYGQEIIEQLDRLTAEERKAFILMARIMPPESLGYMMRRGKVFPMSIVSELGIYGIFMARNDGDSIELNEHCGYLLRSKASNANEGGVAAGYAHLDSILLI